MLDIKKNFLEKKIHTIFLYSKTVALLDKLFKQHLTVEAIDIPLIKNKTINYFFILTPINQE